MTRLDVMLRKEQYEKIWSNYCGFLDLNVNEFMQVQERLLMEQIELLSKCELGKTIMGANVKPSSVKEFREIVPLTTYEDYADILLSKNEDALPSKPSYWIKTTWKGGTHEIKLAPYSETMIEEHTKAFIASLILATSKKRGDFSLDVNYKFLYGMAPLPYLTGLTPYGLSKEIDFEYLPPIEEAENLGFEERNKVGFQLALTKGIDLFFGLSSVLVKIGEDFTKGSTSRKHSFKIGSKKMLYRTIKAYIKKSITKKAILPKDLWDVKGILCAGTDTDAFKEKIEYYWGKRPKEIYGGTETATVATETWGDSGLTFFPDVNFLEFIPEKDALKSHEEKDYIPPTILIDEIKPGERYELVITKFRGGAFVRYRVGDIIECLSLNNEAYNINLPQIRFVDRISNVIDLAGFTRITKSTIEKSIELSELDIKNWVACKQYEGIHPILHIYLESDTDYDYEILQSVLKENMQKFDSDFMDIEILLEKNPLKITVLTSGTFKKYKEVSKSTIIQMNPSKEIIKLLLKCQ